METEQFNIRLPKDLLNDLGLISEILHVSKTEFIKVKLSELVYNERQKLLKDIKGLAKDKLILKSQLRKLRKIIKR
tara:strand:- start:106 stop:333 length:228 start_codon:yes stop_codon:yes gene_type:complete